LEFFSCQQSSPTTLDESSSRSILYIIIVHRLLILIYQKDGGIHVVQNAIRNLMDLEKKNYICIEHDAIASLPILWCVTL
jgi:hypothetical protein